MRRSAALLLSVVFVAAAGDARAQSAAPSCAGNAKALGVARTVEIDTTGGPGFGFEHFRQHDFLQRNEVILTFDDGPWVTTRDIIAALAAHCTKATFFPIGKHATYYPEILKEIASAGHSIGNHTWSHQNLARMKPEEARMEIEKGISAVQMSLGAPAAPFFRFPVLQHPPELVKYLGERNVGIFSTDLDSFDFKARTPKSVIDSVMEKLEKHGKGIVLLHDFQKVTADALPELLNRLQTGGYKVVHMRGKTPVQSLPEYDEILKKEIRLPTVSDRPTSSIVRTIAD